MPGYIDEEQLPFTESEVRRALALVVPAEQAASVAAEIAALPAVTDELTRAAEAARARGSQDPAEINPPSWYVSDEIFALLWCLPECTERVETVMARCWIEWEQSIVRGAMGLRGVPADAPPPEEVVREARRKTAPYRRGWTRRKRAMADRLGLPRPDGSVRALPA